MSAPANNPYGHPTTAPLPENYSVGRVRTLKLKHIDPLSCGKMLAALYVFLGLLMSAFFLITAIVGIAGGGAGGNNLAFGLLGSLFLAIFFPVIYGIGGFIGGIILALIYNLGGSIIGGIEMQFEE